MTRDFDAGDEIFLFGQGSGTNYDRPNCPDHRSCCHQGRHRASDRSPTTAVPVRSYPGVGFTKTGSYTIACDGYAVATPETFGDRHLPERRRHSAGGFRWWWRTGSGGRRRHSVDCRGEPKEADDVPAEALPKLSSRVVSELSAAWAPARVAIPAISRPAAGTMSRSPGSGWQFDVDRTVCRRRPRVPAHAGRCIRAASGSSSKRYTTIASALVLRAQ